MFIKKSNVNIPNGNLSYIYGGDGPPIILIHGMGGGAWNYEPSIRELGQWFQCYAINLPGHSDSPRPDRYYEVKDFSQTIIQFMDDLGIEKANLVGMRSGAVIAIDSAVTYPNRISKLVLSGSPAWTSDGAKERILNMINTSDNNGYPKPWTWEQAQEKLVVNLDNTIIDLFNKAILDMKDWYNLCHEAVYNYDIPSRLGEVESPTLIVFGELDKRFIGGADTLANGIKNSKLELIPETKALPCYERPQIFAEILKEFLS